VIWVDFDCDLYTRALNLRDCTRTREWQLHCEVDLRTGAGDKPAVSMQTNGYDQSHFLGVPRISVDDVPSNATCPLPPTFCLPQPPTRSLGLDDSLKASLLASMLHHTVFRHASSIDHVLRAGGHASRPLHLGGIPVFGGERFPLVPVVDVTVTANRVVLRTAL
jgi:hypothetical protein